MRPRLNAAVRRSATAIDRSLAVAGDRFPPSMQRGPLGAMLRRVGSRIRGSARAFGVSRRPASSQRAREMMTQAAAAAAAGATDRALDLLIDATEQGALYVPVADIPRRSAALRAVAATAEARARLDIALSKHWHIPGMQLKSGAFMLDLGLGDGREHVVTGYRQLALRRWPALVEEFNASDKPLRPSFMIVGPPKAATTTLYGLLTQHPRVIQAPRKELHFWTGPDVSPALYDKYFPPLGETSGCITGEATPTYIAHPSVARAVAEHYPEMRAIVLHRDPVARAYSQYHMRLRNGNEKRTFAAALDDELAAIGDHPPLRPGELDNTQSRYLRMSCILPGVRAWVDQLGAERVLVVDTACLSESRDETLAGIELFLGLEPMPLEDSRSRNVGTYQPIPDALAARMRDWFAPHEIALREFLEDHPTKIVRPRG